MQAAREIDSAQSGCLPVESPDSGQMLAQMISEALSFHEGQNIQLSWLKGFVRNNQGRQSKQMIVERSRLEK